MTKVKTLRALAVSGCALLEDGITSQGNFDIQRRSDFVPRWLCKALTEVAVVLCLLAAAHGIQAQTVAPPVPLTAEQRFDAALVEYERNHWPEAYAALSSLADRGHPNAARMALQMRQFGPALYGCEFVASAGQLAQWKQRWGCTGEVTGTGCQKALDAP